MVDIADSVEADEAGSDLLLWILVWSELAAFGILLVGFLVMSVIQQESFSEARLNLDARLASINTLVLLASGWQAASAAMSGSAARRRISLLVSALLGFVFVAIKLVEYSGELQFAGETAFSTFYELYFLITGFHLAHVVFLGIIMAIVAWRPEPSNVAIVTTLWHVIDLVWLVIFPVVYLG